jgi:hypothetical protein
MATMFSLAKNKKAHHLRVLQIMGGLFLLKRNAFGGSPPPLNFLIERANTDENKLEGRCYEQ